MPHFNALSKLVALICIMILLPLFPVVFVLVKIDSNGPFLFAQIRIGKDKKKFTIYKIRSMIQGAEGIKNTYKHLNEYSEPIFKITDDPRYTKIGKWLAHFGLDELPQLINIIKGDMAFFGPRPLPPDEANKIPTKYHKRFLVSPGMIPPWVLFGREALKSNKWLELDMKFVENNSFRSNLFALINLIKMFTT